MASRLKWISPYRSLLSFLTALSLVLSSVHAYFVITQPSSSSPLANGSPYPLSWSMGLLDGIGSFDIELIRLSEDGIFYIARNVPATWSSFNVLLQDVPEGNDYFVVCLNSTSSQIFTVSDRFTVTNSSASQNPSPNSAAPTVTISGPPNPLQTFAVTMGPAISGARSFIFGPNPNALGLGGAVVLCAAFLGGVMALA